MLTQSPATAGPQRRAPSRDARRCGARRTMSATTSRIAGKRVFNVIRANIMKICVFGAGAIGALMGVQLARAGADVSFVARGPHLAAMREHGVRVLMDGEEVSARVRCTSDPSELGVQD